MRNLVTLVACLAVTMAVAQSALGLRSGMCDIRFFRMKATDQSAEYAASAGVSVGLEWQHANSKGHLLSLAVQRDRQQLHYDVKTHGRVGGSGMDAEHTLDRYGLRAAYLWKLAGQKVRLLAGPGVAVTGMHVRRSSGEGYQWQVMSELNPETGETEYHAKWDHTRYNGRQPDAIAPVYLSAFMALRIQMELSPRWGVGVGGSAEVLLSRWVRERDVRFTSNRTIEGTVGLYYMFRK